MSCFLVFLHACVCLLLLVSNCIPYFFQCRVRPISPGSISPSSTQAPVVNFRDIGDLAKSANRDQTGMVYIAVNPHSLTPGTQAPILIGVSDLVSFLPCKQDYLVSGSFKLPYSHTFSQVALLLRMKEKKTVLVNQSLKSPK